jgi:hypothetical protein
MPDGSTAVGPPARVILSSLETTAQSALADQLDS